MIHLQSANPFFEFIERSKKYPDEYPEKIHKQIKMQEEMLHLFEFREERVAGSNNKTIYIREQQ